MFLGVLFGALGSHALKARLTPDALQSYMIAIRYLLFHGVALLALAGLPYLDEIAKGRIALVLVIGIFVFSGSIIALSTKAIHQLQVSWLGPVTPFGRVVVVSRLGLPYFSIGKTVERLGQFLDVLFNGHGHGRRVFGWCFDVNTEFSLISCFYSSISINCDTGVVLFKVWEVFEQGLYSRRTKEDQNVVIDVAEVRQIAHYGAVHLCAFPVER